MTTTLACPDETELLALAMGEPVAAAMMASVDGCAKCRTRLEQLQAEVASLRQSRGQATTTPSIELDPAVNQDREPPGVSTNEDCSSAEPGNTTPFAPERFTTSPNDSSPAALARDCTQRADPDYE